MKSNHSGFTLVEVLISVFILSMVVASASTAFVFAIKTTRDDEIRMTAMNLANDKVEYIRSLDFGNIGKVTYGDPVGIIPDADENKLVNGLEYCINIQINWVNTDRDYKIVRVNVVPKGMEKFIQTLETYVAKESFESVTKGANLIIAFSRGWKNNAEEDVPVPYAQALIKKGPSAVRYVPSSSEGKAIFVDLLPGNYTGKVTAPTGMILKPGQSAKWIRELKNMTTEIIQYEVDEPSSLQITLKDINRNPISLPPDTNIDLLLIDFDNNEVICKFKGKDLNSDGTLPDITDLWPVGKGNPGSYTIKEIVINSLDLLDCKENNNNISENKWTKWNGKFDGPGTCKKVTCYFVKSVEPPKEATTDWVHDNGGGICQDKYYRADGSEGTFVTPNMNYSLSLNVTKGCNDFTAQKIFFLNIGNNYNPGLIINTNSKITLHAEYIDFAGWVKFNRGYTGKILLSTKGYDDYPLSPVKVEGDVEYGILRVHQYMKIGDESNTPVFLNNGYYFFKDGTELPRDAQQLIRMTIDDVIEYK
jgi:prepilin-type N-terminal cleavage/methylation domain-containing protein